MKKLLLLLLTLVLIIGLVACAGQQEADVEEIPENPERSETPDTPETPEMPEHLEDFGWGFFNERAEAFITAMAEGDFDASHAMLDETMAAAFDAGSLQAMWADIIALAGEFIAIHEIENAEVEEYYISGVIAQHEAIGFGWNIVFSEDGYIAGIHTAGTIQLPDEAASSPTALNPVQRDGFTDYPIVIGEGTAYPLDGILSMPDDAAGLVPAVVLVHGSGPGDMDSNMFGNRPFRDIADFLAANGIAVVRYDKRTHTHAAQLLQDFGDSMTVWEETIEDAIFATELLKADPRVDESRVFMIGHSLGGLLAPRIHAEGGDFAGLILLATTPRPVMSVILPEQLTASWTSGYEAGLIDSETLEEQHAEVEAMTELLAAIPDMTDEEAKETSVFGVSAYYIRDLEVPTFADHVRDVTIPIFVMHGGRDFQTPVDPCFYLFQEIFAGRDNVTLKLYEDLNHIFMLSTATSFTEHANEIMEGTGSVYAPALQDMVDWINGR